MKYMFPIAMILLTIISCKEEKAKPLSFVEKVAQANGIEHWKDVSELRFTFNVDRDTIHFERDWAWNPKTGQVAMTYNGETTSYNREAVDERSLKADKAFVNDTYWLLAPFKLIWDEGYTRDSIIRDEAPISKDTLYKLTIHYTGDGGYTPGDAYDFFIDKDHMIREWIYREDNSTSNCFITTWEDYTEEGNIKFSTLHKDETGGFRLYFSDIEVIKD